MRAWICRKSCMQPAMLLCVKINVHTEEAERRVQAMRGMSRGRTGVYSVVSPVSCLLKKRAFPRTCFTLALYHVFYRFVEPHTCMRIAVPVIRLFLPVIFTKMVRKHRAISCTPRTAVGLR